MKTTRTLIVAAGSLLAASSLSAAVKTWAGNTDTNWATGANWGGTAPVASDSLTFDVAGSSGTSLTNTITAGTSFAGVTFNTGASAYTMSGNTFTIGGNIANNSSNVQTFGQAVTVSGIRAFTGGNLAFGTLNVTALTVSGSNNSATLVNLSSAGNSLTVNGALAATTLQISNSNPSGTINGTGAITGTDFKVAGNVGPRGIFAMTGAGSATFSNNITVGSNSNTAANALPLLTQNSGTLSAKGLVLGGDATVYTTAQTRTYTMTGGTLNLGSGGITSSASLGAGGSFTAAVNLGAGTVGATANWSSSLAMALTNAATGTTLDTTGGNIALAGNLTGAGKLVKSGSGTLTLSGTNAYSGATAVTGGTLNIASVGSIHVGASGVTVSATSTLAVDGKLVLTSTTQNLIANSGTITFASGTAVLDLNNLFNGATDGQTYNLISGGTTTGDFFNITGYTGGLNTAFDSTTGTLTFTAVPEPATYGLIGAGALAIVSGIRRRRKAAGHAA
jgi:hypothetical protein